MNPRRYPRGPRYRVDARGRPRQARQRLWRLTLAACALVVAAAGIGGASWALLSRSDSPDVVSLIRDDAAGSAMDATRPRDLVTSPRAFFTPTPAPPPPTPTPKPKPAVDPTLTSGEIGEIIVFANQVLRLDNRQRNIIRDYRYYDIDLLTRWIGESQTASERLLRRQLQLLEEMREVESPDLEGADEVASLYVESAELFAEAFIWMNARLLPLNEAGVSVVMAIRTGMFPVVDDHEALSRSAMLRRDARERLATLVNRAGLIIGNIDDMQRLGSAGN